MNNKYDVIIIGAGVGGLVCGCYLAKAGMKTLIIEKHDKPGGYCQSFERNGFTFDAGPHIIGSCNKGGLLHKIFNELKIGGNFKKSTFVDTYNFGNDIIKVSQNIEEYKNFLAKKFKNEKNNINRYFQALFDLANKFINKRIEKKEAKMSYKIFLDKYIKNPDLKCILSVHCGYLGLTPDNLSCVAMAMTEWSYLKEGTYNFRYNSDDFVKSLLAKYFEYGGTLKLKEEIKNIDLNKNNSRYHLLISQSDKVYLCNKLVLNIDPLKFYNYLINKDKIRARFLFYLNKYVFTPSLLIAYVGINFKKNLEFISGWHFASYNQKDILDKSYYIHVKNNKENGSKSIHIIKFQLGNAIKNENRIDIKRKWETEAIGLLKKMLIDEKWEIKTISSADFVTLENQTNNRYGSVYGYSMNMHQAYSNIFNKLTNDEDIYFVGHWSTFGGGIVPVAISGKSVANVIINKG